MYIIIEYFIQLKKDHVSNVGNYNDLLLACFQHQPDLGNNPNNPNNPDNPS